MKLPALAITALFGGGIAIGLCQAVVTQASSRSLVCAGFLTIAFLILYGFWVTRAGHLIAGFTAASFAWILLGILGALLASQPLPAEHALTMIQQGRLDLSTPLRWHGTLRDEPSHLPWGYSYEIALSAVGYQNVLRPARGGLRFTFTPHSGEERLPELHAGDEVAVLTQARRPQVFKDEGAFDRRAYLARQGIDLTASLLAPELLVRTARARPTVATVIARTRRRLREEFDAMFAAKPQVAGVLRAMLLGDRSFIERDEATDFQKTGVFHVLVVAGLHVGALALFLFWAGRKLRLAAAWTIAATLLLLFSYVAVVEQRPPVIRAALMAALVALGAFFYRKLELLNSAAMAALVLLVWDPIFLQDASFQLTFVAIGCIGALALPWLEETVQPYAVALRGWRDITRDAAHDPRPTQFRIDLRASVRWISARAPRRLATASENAFVAAIAFSVRVWELFILTIVLQIGMLPLMAGNFHRITLAAPVVNLVAVPLTSLLVPLGFLTLGTGLLFPLLGKLIAIPLGWLALLLLNVVKWFANFPRWTYRIPGPPLWLVILFFASAVLLAVAVRMTHSRRRASVRILCCALLTCSALIATFPFSPRRAIGKLEATILDVGQGDSLFIVSPRGKTLLIDGGGAFVGFPGRDQHSGTDPGEEAVSPYLWSRGLRKLDVVALTHAHQDHLGGLTAVLQNFSVGRLWIGREVSSKALAQLEGLARARGIPIEHETRGDRFAWDGMEGSFFWPETSSEPVASLAKNNDSLVLRLQYGRRTLLLPGDAEKDAERTILGENDADALHADVLKIAHHGSKNSTTPEFLEAVGPHIAVISAGESNPYGHPSPELLERLQAARVRILRTDRDGAIHVLTDGNRIEISCFVPCAAPLDQDNALKQAQTPDYQ